MVDCHGASGPGVTWAYLNGVELDFAHGDAFIEAFNARIRAEYLNPSWFLSLADARKRIEAWRIE